MEDNVESKNLSVSNGKPYVEEINDDNGPFSEMKGNGTEVLEEIKHQLSHSSHTARRKGHGLKKWRRVRRDVTQDDESEGYVERNQKSEGSASSTNAVVKNLNGFDLFGTVAGIDSENSEDRSSKSSTAASAPMIKFERPMVVGVRISVGRNSAHSVQRGQQGNAGIENGKKARGERVKIEKENSHSSLESDSRSSNFVFMQETCSTSNGVRSNSPIPYEDEEGVDDVEGSDYGRGHVEDVTADSSCEVKEERSNDHVSPTNQDTVVESISSLQSVQEALEKELLKFKAINPDVSVDSFLELSQTSDVEQELSEQMTSGEGTNNSSRAVHIDLETELDDVYKQRIEAQIEILTISRSIQKLRHAAVNQITVLKEQKALSSERALTIEKLGDIVNKDAMLKKESEKLEVVSEDIAIADETLRLQKRVCKYTSCFFLQLVLLVAILGIFISQLSPKYYEVVPT